MEFLDSDTKTSHIHSAHPELMQRLYKAELEAVHSKISTTSSNNMNPYKQKEFQSKQIVQEKKKQKVTESNSFLADLLK